MPDERHLRVFADRSILVRPDGSTVEFPEGTQSLESWRRTQVLRDGIKTFLESRIREALVDRPPGRPITPDQQDLLEAMLDGQTSEVGRAIVALAITQATVKSIEPEQDIRLHKGNRSAGTFGWREGTSLRQLSAAVGGVLRTEGLLRINADGPMMTRSLAENYPYTTLYKAALRGPKREWLRFVELVQERSLDANAALEYLLIGLGQREERFVDAADKLVRLARAAASTDPSFEDVRTLIRGHFESAAHSARLFELAMHSLMQALEDRGGLDGSLRPLPQMRTADLKAGKVADIEVSNFGDLDLIVVAYDAKYGRPYLIEELHGSAFKMRMHPSLGELGFVVDASPIIDPDVESAIADLQDEFGIPVLVEGFDDWSIRMTGHLPGGVGGAWLCAYAESLALQRRARAPIDEPTYEWVLELTDLLQQPIWPVDTPRRTESGMARRGTRPPSSTPADS